MKPNCEHCKFHYDGECRRFPMTLLSTGYSKFPNTNTGTWRDDAQGIKQFVADDWCGEFVKEEEQD